MEGRIQRPGLCLQIGKLLSLLVWKEAASCRPKTSGQALGAGFCSQMIRVRTQLCNEQVNIPGRSITKAESKFLCQQNGDNDSHSGVL